MKLRIVNNEELKIDTMALHVIQNYQTMLSKNLMQNQPFNIISKFY